MSSEAVRVTDDFTTLTSSKLKSSQINSGVITKEEKKFLTKKKRKMFRSLKMYLIPVKTFISLIWKLSCTVTWFPFMHFPTVLKFCN